MRKILCIFITLLLLTTMVEAKEILFFEKIEKNEGQIIASVSLLYLNQKYNSNFCDCSSYVQFIFKKCGYTIGRTCTAQSQNGIKIQYEDLLPGDLVLFERTYNTKGYSHVGIYIGNNNFIHRANSRDGVIISSLEEKYYNSRFVCGVRIWDQNKTFTFFIFLK